jgi:hypothetical protein
MMVIPNRGRVVALMLALALVGGLLTLALLVKPAQAQATIYQFNERYPFTFSFTNPCTGEEVTGEGTSHIVGNYTNDGRGGFHLNQSTSGSGTGVGSTSGATYTVTSAGHDTLNVSSAEYPLTITFIQHVQYIRQGEDMPGDDLVFDMTYHVTYDANGEVTAEIGVDPETGEIVLNEECR